MQCVDQGRVHRWVMGGGRGRGRGLGERLSTIQVMWLDPGS